MAGGTCYPPWPRRLPRGGTGYARLRSNGCPPDIQDCPQFQLVGDVVGLVLTLGYKEAVIAGHDLGAMVAHNLGRSPEVAQ